MDDRISGDGSPSIRAIVPLPFSSVKPDIDTIVKLVVVEVNMGNLSILNQTTHGGSVHRIWLVRHCPSNRVIGRENICVFPEASSKPHK